MKLDSFILTMRNLNPSDQGIAPTLSPRFILTMRNLNGKNNVPVVQISKGFILTMRNLNQVEINSSNNLLRFILTMRNLNKEKFRLIKQLESVLY